MPWLFCLSFRTLKFTKYKKGKHNARKNSYDFFFFQMSQTKSKTAGKMLTRKLSVEKLVVQYFVLFLAYFPFLLPSHLSH